MNTQWINEYSLFIVPNKFENSTNWNFYKVLAAFGWRYLFSFVKFVKCTNQSCSVSSFRLYFMALK